MRKVRQGLLNINAKFNNLVTMDMFITVTRMQKIHIISLPWLILKAFRWQQAGMLIIQTRLKRMIIQPTHGQKLQSIRIINSKCNFSFDFDK